MFFYYLNKYMFKQLEINPNFQYTEGENYSIDISPLNSDIVICTNNRCNIYSKSNFLSKEEELIPQNKEIIESKDDFIYSKFSKDGKFLYTSDYEYQIKKYSTEENKYDLLQTFKPGNLKNWKFSLSKDNKYLVTGSYNVILYNTNDSNKEKEISNNSRFIYSYCFLPNNKLAVGNSNGSVHIINLENSKIEKKIEEHCMIVRCLAYNEEKNILLTASDDLHINLIDLKTYKLMSPIVGHNDYISQMIFNENKQILFTCSFDGNIKAFDFKKNNICFATLSEGKDNILWDIGVSDDANFICSIGENKLSAYSFI